ncbi:MAG: PAS domain-containing protein [Deltaproteobacteria bacterium]|jgi:nitrogen-specific signal transduction histidine kinase|nr:PAS domain-containing protein [Deltaproteobacteria bacterium]MCW9049611.1 PAS domain-containing protein [Deltaproteobacteria bacterium]
MTTENNPSAEFLADLLNSLKNPLLVADTDHKVLYLNRAAEDFYTGGSNLLGSSLLACHNQQSQQQMRDILERMQEGLDEEIITDNEKWRIYMRAMRSATGELVGYYERYEPPRGS